MACTGLHALPAVRLSVVAQEAGSTGVRGGQKMMINKRPLVLVFARLSTVCRVTASVIMLDEFEKLGKRYERSDMVDGFLRMFHKGVAVDPLCAASFIELSQIPGEAHRLAGQKCYKQS
mmetsp:Transcript_28247/g.61996  ORF Transcript_28247/g.61996 Transcript_28247/m.61996 type:complete len:119 (-) Transcript_28247:705-1061(-)|eukprot:CAMPEP_0202892680 /NCGR_PEP_ID=MMETSP1392-20130828/2389_1 /ASSEMBLY_ACC=CAM_ASM_000868 /TAXON_ID=225041 /ORGANISM="Chlamydomonas chlamydogama, Strain SAG 11-48b" /LENGTH=118 /DNA_ID=CAMNT_0049576731 /DNA_START=96 /DNA_END=452 /DNA_ORIENTATION=+